jgi:hypothetical protein
MGGGIVYGLESRMPEAIGISPSISASSISQRTDIYEFISVALFSGVGLLLSLAAVLAGVQGVWS